MPKSELLNFETTIFTKLLFALIKLFSGISEKSIVPFGFAVGLALGASVGLSVSGASVSFAPSVGSAVTAAVGSDVEAFAVGAGVFPGVTFPEQAASASMSAASATVSIFLAFEDFLRLFTGGILLESMICFASRTRGMALLALSFAYAA